MLIPFLLHYKSVCRLKWRLCGKVMQDDNDNWNDMFRALLKHGTNKKGTYDVLKSLRVPVTSEDGPSQVLHLGVWLHKQREEKLKGSLHADKEALLQVSSVIHCCGVQNPRPVLLYPTLPCHSMLCHTIPCFILLCTALNGMEAIDAIRFHAIKWCR